MTYADWHIPLSRIIPRHLMVVSHSVLGGLHHEYELVPKAA